MSNTSSTIFTRELNRSTILSCNFEEVEGYSDVYFRPYTVNGTSQAIGQTAAVIHDASVNSGVLDQSFISSALSNTIQLDQPTVVAPIVNGWNQRRLRFQIVAQFEYTDGTIEDHVIEGFTCHYEPPVRLATNTDVKASSIIANDTRFFINNSYFTRKEQVANRKTITARENNQHINAQSDMRIETIRPNDIFTVAQLSKHTDGEVALVTGQDTTQRLVDNSLLSPTCYMATLINSYLKTMNSTEDNRYDYHGQPVSGHSGIPYVKQSTLAENSLLRILTNAVGYRKVINMEFTFSDLVSLSPTIDHIATLSLLTPGLLLDSEYNGANTTEAHFANIFAITLRSIMKRIGITYATLIATNRTVTSEHSCHVSKIHFHPTPGKDVRVENSSLRSKLTTSIHAEILGIVSHGGLMEYTVDVSATMCGDISMIVNTDGHDVKFVIPVFADGLYSPVATPGTSNDVAQTLSNMMDTVRSMSYEDAVSVNGIGVTFEN